MSHFVYVLRSLKSGRRYIGSTSDLTKRLQNHNAGKVRSTKFYRPYEIIYREVFPTKTEALKREKFFKTIDGYNFLKSLNL